MTLPASAVCLRSCALLLALASASAAAAQPAAGESDFSVFLYGTRVGAVQSALTQTSDGWLIRGSGDLGAPLDFSVHRLEILYDREWQPGYMSMEITNRAESRIVHGAFQRTRPSLVDVISGRNVYYGTPAVSPDALILPPFVFAAYEAVAARLETAAPGGELRAYMVPDREIRIRLDSVAEERVETIAGPMSAGRWRMTLLEPTGALPMEVWVDRARLLRLDMPGHGVSMIRDDWPSAMPATRTVSLPNDVEVSIPANGTHLAATLTRPATTGEAAPVVILVSGPGPTDRHETVAGVPIFADIARDLAEAGCVVIRYDKRGAGARQTGLFDASLSEMADDVSAVVRFARAWDGVDRDRVYVLGYGDGGWVALAAAGNAAGIRGVILAGTPGRRGTEVVLERQAALLEDARVPQPDRDRTVALQRRMLDAVLTGRWDGIPDELRERADTAWYRSTLLFDPVRAVGEIEQPMLVLHGELDREVPPYHARELASARSGQSSSTRLLTFPGLNHLLVPASTGTIAEYAGLQERTVSSSVTDAIADWVASH